METNCAGAEAAIEKLRDAARRPVPAEIAPTVPTRRILIAGALLP